MFERVLVNWLENAAKYAGPDAQITLKARHNGEQLEICVLDNGPGLPPGQEQAIFDKFSRGNRESVIPGVGLGLAICRAIMEAHGGQISGSNRPEGGACFCCTLPYQAPPPLWDDVVEEM